MQVVDIDWIFDGRITQFVCCAIDESLFDATTTHPDAETGIVVIPAIAQTLNTPKFREKIEAQGAEVFVKNPEEYAAFLQADAKLMLELIKAANMTTSAN